MDLESAGITISATTGDGVDQLLARVKRVQIVACGTSYHAGMVARYAVEHWARLPPSVREQFTDTALQGLWEHVVEATANGGFDHPKNHVSWTTLDLEREGRDEVARILSETLESVLVELAASAGREAERSPQERESERTELAILHYRRPRADEG